MRRITQRLLKAAVLAGLCLGCTAAPPVAEPQWLTATEFYALPQDMTKDRFLREWQAPRKHRIGGLPVATCITYPGLDVWEVFVYDVYAPAGDPAMTVPVRTRREYVFFKNGRLKGYGDGSLALAPRDVLRERGVGAAGG